jgi:NAD(P)-dependent dehydrogenase (short-subunit alcohol dehydrogenase family)
MSAGMSVVVTGASTGIGLGTAKVLLKRGARVFGSVRKSEDAERLQQELGASFTPLLFDVTDQAAVQRAAGEVREKLQGSTLSGLVNNAGVAVSGPSLELSPDDFRRQLEVNVLGPFMVTQAFGPLLGKDPALKGPPGRIVNVSSVGGKMGAPFLGPYVASKHALEGWSECLRRELMLYGIDVIIVGPGTVATPIWDKAEQADISRYDRSDFREVLHKFKAYMVKNGPKGLPPERIGEVIWTALTARSPKVRYAVVPNALIDWILPIALPARVADRLIAGQLGLLRGRRSLP